MNLCYRLISTVIVYMAITTVAIAGLSGDVEPERGAATKNDVAPVANAQPSPERSPIAPQSVDAGVGEDSGLLPLPLPPGQPTYHHYYNVASGLVTDVRPQPSSVAGAMEPIKVYSNTPPPMFTFRASGFELGDDIISVAVGGCDVSMYAIQMGRSVMGCSNNNRPCENDNQCYGGGPCIVRPDPGFSTSVALYDACPDEGGQLIPGTEATIAVPTDGIHTITIDLSGSPINVDSSFWIILTTDKPNAGVIVGEPAFIGFTDNKHHVAPPIPCEARFPSVIYAGYHVEVYCVGEFDREFLAYFNPADAENDGLFAPGADVWIADDITLIIDDCQLSSYEITSQADGGSFGLEAQLWRACNEATLIAGTEGSFAGLGNGTLEIARFDFPTAGPDVINLPESLWVAWRYDTARGKVFIAEEPVLGESANIFGLLPMGCGFIFGGGGPQASFAISVRCGGDRPLGACCDLTPLMSGADEAICRETPDLACLDAPSLKRWTQGASCNDLDAFDPLCGTVACCVLDPQPHGTCVDVLPDECDSFGGIAGGLRNCEPDSSSCGWFPCLLSEGDCCLAGDLASCVDNACCNRICGFDSWCCEVEWDDVCIDEALEFCQSSCPADFFSWFDPRDGVVDARQPHPPLDESLEQGFDSFVVTLSEYASTCCWRVCHSDGVVSIENVVNLENGKQQVTTARRLAGGNAARVVYLRTERSGDFTFHPGNVNRDEVSNPADVAALMDFLQGDLILPGGLSSCDMDRSGVCGPADLLRLIDLLHGGATYLPWNGTALPEPLQDCP